MRSSIAPAVVLLLASLAGGACTGFRAVREGVYRCPQPTEHQLAKTIADHDVRTVVCLRGSGRGQETSARVATQHGVHFLTVPMSATRAPRPETLLALWEVAATAERPLLLHCRAGVDRTGLAAALVVLHDTGDLAAARAELALLPHGHVAWSRTGVLDEVLDAYAPFHGTLAFPDWVKEHYAADQAATPR